MGPGCDAVLRHCGDLKAIPGVAGQVLASLADPRASANRVGQEISRDQALTATVLRAANSSFYRASREVRDVTEALVIVGFTSIRDLLVGRLSRLVHRKKDEVQTALWKHALATGLAAQAYVRRRRGLTVSHAFICGLLHDIGKALLYEVYGEKYREVLDLAVTFDCPSDEIERDRFGTDHAEVGGELLRMWQFPLVCEMVARFHHDAEALEALPEKQRKMLALVQVANDVATWTRDGVGRSEPTSDLDHLPAMDALSVNRGVVEAMVEHVVTEMAALEAIFG